MFYLLWAKHCSNHWMLVATLWGHIAPHPLQMRPHSTFFMTRLSYDKAQPRVLWGRLNAVVHVKDAALGNVLHEHWPTFIMAVTLSPCLLFPVYFPHLGYTSSSPFRCFRSNWHPSGASVVCFSLEWPHIIRYRTWICLGERRSSSHKVFLGTLNLNFCLLCHAWFLESTWQKQKHMFLSVPAPERLQGSPLVVFVPERVRTRGKGGR